MKKLILISAFSFAFMTGEAQVKSFTTDINDSFSTSFQSYSMRQTTDGGYIETGTILEKNGALFLVKLDPYGKKRWYNIILDSFNNFGNAVRQTSDGGYAVSGTTNINGNYDVLLDKFDTAGTLLWSKNYGTPNPEYGNALQITKDAGYIIAGFSQYTDSLYTTYDFGYAVKANSKGDTSWTFGIGDINHQTVFNSIFQTADGGYILGGYRITDTLYYSNYILKLDSNGKKVWDKVYGDQTNIFDYFINSIIQTKDGNYIATGMKGPDSTFAVGGISHLFVFKLNASGDSLWQYYFANDSSYGRDITQAADGEYVVAGANDFGAYDNIYIAKISSSGKKRWESNLPTVTNGWGTSIMQATGGGYALAGIQIVNGSYYGALAIKTDTSGNISVPNDTLYLPDSIVTTTTTGIAGTKTNPLQIITLYPNPFSIQTTIYVKDVSLQNALLSIYDINGKEINQVENISGNQIIINRNNLSNGVYFYRLVNNGQVISTGKIIVE